MKILIFVIFIADIFNEHFNYFNYCNMFTNFIVHFYQIFVKFKWVQWVCACSKVLAPHIMVDTFATFLVPMPAYWHSATCHHGGAPGVTLIYRNILK